MHDLVRKTLDLASTQHSVVARDQARQLGLTDAQIDSCVRSGLLVPVAPTGLYRVRGGRQSVEMATTAAVLGTSGCASFSSGCRLLRLDAPLPSSPIDVTVPSTSSQPRLRRLDIETSSHSYFTVRVHRCRDHARPFVTVDGLACTDAARTLIDVASLLDAEDLEAVFERARRLGLVSVESVARRFCAIGGRGRPGTRQIRTLLAGTAPNALDSRLEVKAWRLIRASRLPPPVRQLRIDTASGRYRLDLAWPELMATFETEGFEWHGTRARWKQDRVRVAGIERLGWRHMIGTWDDVVLRADETLERIGLMLEERSVLARSGGFIVPMSAPTRSSAQ